MDYQKLDAGLAAAVDAEDDQEARSLTVFIHTDQTHDEEAKRLLKQLGVSRVDGPILTATLSPGAVAQLSDQPWVQSIKLSHRLSELKKDFGF